VNHGEIHRILVSQPMSAQPYDGHKPPLPVDVRGKRIQVTVHVDEFGHIVERWQFSETDVRWYHLQAWKEKWVTMKVEKRQAVS